MADRIEQFEVVVPAGTPRSAPLEIATGFNPGELEEIEIVIPDGHSGLTGIALALAHQVLIPETAGQFVTSNDEVIHWPVHNFPNSGAWSAFVFNSDVFDHAFFVRYLVREIGSGVVLTEPIAPGQSVTIGVGAGQVGEVAPPDVGTIDIGAGELPPPEPADQGSPPDETPPPDATPPPDETLPPEPADVTAPTDETLPPEPTDETLPPEPAPPPPPPPPPPPAVIQTFGLPADYSAGAVPLFGNPGNVGMLIGQVLGYKQVGQGANNTGSFNTWRFFADLGNTADWNFYVSGAKRGQWVGPFNLRTGVPGG